MNNFKGFTYIDVKAFLAFPMKNGQTLDITSGLMKIELYNSIFDLNVQGIVQFRDPSHKIADLDLNGEEILTLVFEQHDGRTLTKAFHLYSAENISHDETNANITYVVNISTALHYQARSVLVTKGYKNTTADKIFNSVLNDIKQGVKYKLNIEPSKNVIDNYVVSNWSLGEFFDKLGRLAVSSQYNSPYVCFETFSGQLYFCSIEKLIELNTPKNAERKYTNNAFDKTGGLEIDYTTFKGKQYYNVTNFEVIYKNNSVERAEKGGYSNEIVSIDLLNRKVESFKEDITKAKEAIKRSTSVNFELDASPKMITNGQPSISLMKYTNSFNLKNQFDSHSKGLIFFQAFNQTQIGFTTPGDLSLEAGDMFTFYAPANPNSENPNPRLSGKYIAVNVRHDIMNNNFYTTVEANKIGYDKDFK